MKKKLLTIIISLLVGFFLSNFVLKKYDGYKGITVYREGEMLYFFEYGIFDNEKEMEENTINLENYIYQIADNKYYVYVGISKSDEVIKKINNHFTNLGYSTKVKEFYVTNEKFISTIENYDAILLLTDDSTTIGSIISDGLNAYEEEVISESKN